MPHRDKKSFTYSLKLVTPPTHPKAMSKNPEGYKIERNLDYQLIGEAYLDNLMFKTVKRKKRGMSFSILS